MYTVVVGHIILCRLFAHTGRYLAKENERLQQQLAATGAAAAASAAASDEEEESMKMQVKLAETAAHAAHQVRAVHVDVHCTTGIA